MLPPEGRDLILAGAIISIFLNPFLFSLLARWLEAHDPEAEDAETAPPPKPTTTQIVLVGHGRVGSLIAGQLAKRGKLFTVIEDEADMAKQADAAGMNVVKADALEPRTLEAAGIREADTLLIAIPEGFEAGAIAEHARALNPRLRIVARAHSDAEVEHLERLGITHVVMGEREIASRMFAIACG
jgi:CPA2 family monovalent cation:H+ antiporter-2